MNLHEDMRRIKEVMGILQESTPTKFKRLLHVIDKRIDIVLQSPDYESNDFCSVFYDPSAFINTIISEVADEFYYAYFSSLDDSGEEWGNIYNMIVDYIEMEHGKKLTKYWLSICINKNMKLKEQSENSGNFIKRRLSKEELREGLKHALEVTESALAKYSNNIPFELFKKTTILFLLNLLHERIYANTNKFEFLHGDLTDYLSNLFHDEIMERYNEITSED